MTNPKLALAMILKGDEPVETVERCLSTIAKWVDGIFITITTPDQGVSEICKKYGAFIDEQPYKFHREATQEEIDWLKGSFGYEPYLKVGDKVFLFDAARNHNFDQIGKEYDWILWMDADDVFRAGQNIREVMQDAVKKNAESVFLNYIYQAVIEDGKIKQILIQHTRERFIKNNGAYRWIAPIHETLIEQRQTVKIGSDKCDVLHLTTDVKMREAITRNMKTLELSIYDTQARDPRPIWYLAKAYFDLKDKESLLKMIGLTKIYLYGSKEYDYSNRSGWGEERSQAWEYLSEAYRILGEYDSSITCCLNAMRESYKFPSIYLNLGLSYLMKGDWEASLHWVKQALNVPPPQSTLVSNPRDLKARALEITYHATLNLSLLDEARLAAEELLDLFPDSQEMINRVRFTHNLTQEREATKSIVLLAKYLEAIGEKQKLQLLINAAPSTVANNPFLVDLHKKVFPPRKWDDNEIAIVCGQGYTSWSPKLLENPNGSFMGGSEEAVVYLSKELAKLGWKVHVYGDPGSDEGEYQGVIYHPYYKFNHLDEFNILVAWRQPAFVDGNYKAKKMYLWCHDLLNSLDFTPERVTKWEKIIVLSPFHRSLIPNVVDEKVLISANGIDI